MNNLGKTIVLLRLRELAGEKIDFPDTCYQGEYIKSIAAQIIKSKQNKYFAKDNEDKQISYLTNIAGHIILEDIKGDLKNFGVIFDEYFSESKLYDNDGVAKIWKVLEKSGFVYSNRETLWFKTSGIRR